jgi:hypothetical protein
MDKDGCVTFLVADRNVYVTLLVADRNVYVTLLVADRNVYVTFLWKNAYGPVFNSFLKHRRDACTRFFYMIRPVWRPAFLKYNFPILF